MPKKGFQATEEEAPTIHQKCPEKKNFFIAKRRISGYFWDLSLKASFCPSSPHVHGSGSCLFLRSVDANFQGSKHSENIYRRRPAGVRPPQQLGNNNDVHFS